MSEILEGFTLIEDQLTLENQVESWTLEAVLAIDTEFMRTDTYYAKPGLIQIADSKGVFIIDPLKVSSLKPLAVLLADPNIVKIMHAMSEDIELLYHATGVLTQCVFDTQIAAAFLGFGASLGYQNLVSEVLGFPVDKSETRSDWLKRPLTDKQLAYAAKDAEYLILLHRELETALIDKALLDSVFDEASNILVHTKQSWDQPAAAYLKLRGAYELPLARQQLLQKLVIWRDQKAQSDNVPKPWVFGDKYLIQFAETIPKTISDIRNIKDIKPKSIRLYGEGLIAQLSALDGTSNKLEDDFVAIDRPVKGDELQLFKKLKAIVNDVAEKTGIAPQLLGTRKMLENTVIHVVRNNHNTLPSELSNWRKKLMEEQFLEILKHDVSNS
jgi:ribonuclease D